MKFNKKIILGIVLLLLMILAVLVYLLLVRQNRLSLELFTDNAETKIIKDKDDLNVNLETEPIDIVYTWVDQYDPERDAYMKKEGFTDPKSDHTGIKRYKNTNELQYSLRSIAKYCPWVNKIYIIVKDGQQPKFIDFNNPQIKLVNHSEIMPAEILPTFSSLVIELFIHKIPGLTKRYLYFNDDMFVNKPISKSDLFDSKGYPYITMKNYSEGIVPPVKNAKELNFNYTLQTTMHQVQKILGVKYYFNISHVPGVCYKPWEQEIEDLLKKNNIWQTLIKSKTRRNSDIVVNNVFRCAYYKEKGSQIANNTWQDNFIQLNSYNRDCKINIKPNSAFYCINAVEPQCEKIYFDFMNRYYPNPSIWEVKS
jgi:hypothetical protein